ncbi:MAG: hypothetical protein KA586_07640 [Candidatus Promineofilum sp.]|nr:hypothetical protein [Promineifilum sp.]
MDRKWLGIILVISLLANGVLLVLFTRQKAADPDRRVDAVEQLVESAATATISPPSTVTPRRQPAVMQASQSRATATVVPTKTAPTPTEALVLEEATKAPTVLSPTEVPSASPTALPTPTATPEAPPSPTIEAVGTDWLQYLNIFRRESNLPPLLENAAWSLDSVQHDRYMAYTGNLGHSEDVASAYYTTSGQTAGENGNIAAGYLGSDPFKWAFNYWMSAPFHAIPIIDPQLQTTGFAEYRDAAAEEPLTATLDVRRGLGPLPEGVTFPIMYPRDGGTTWVLRYSLPEFPEALSTCIGYTQPTGAPIILQIGDGREVPNVTATALYRDGEYLAHCYFDETNFTHANEFRQKSARLILDQRDAVVIIPQQPLLPDSTYSVRVDANGTTYTWSFHTRAGPP